MSLFVLVSIFSICLVCLFAMVFYRSWELKTKKVETLSEAMVGIISAFRLDKFLYSFLKIYKNMAEKGLSMLLQYGKIAIHRLEELLKRVPQPSFMQKTVDFVYGKNLPGTKKGSLPTSAFIREIVEHKEQIRNNKG